ncbi:MAG: PAS domain-containing sensor histidine kinase [Duncaniella sp.]|nr:PAS domain-containing sensor histidine kinase [Duncaniella sp.]
MRLSWIFTLTLFLLSGSVVALMLLDYGSTPYKVMWGVALLCVVLIILFYLNILRPLKTLANGIDLLRAQDFSSRLARVGQREADHIVDMFNSMMDALKQERLRLREQNHFLDLLVGVSPLAIIILDREGRMTDANKAAATFLGADTGASLAGLTPGDTGTELGQILGSLADDEVRVVRLNDSMVYRCSRLSFMESGYSHPFLIVEQLTDEVRKAEKKSYEKVIRMIAHEVNNSVGAVTSVLGTAASEVSDPDLTEALTACERRCRDMSAFITKFASAVKIPEAVKTECRMDLLLHSWAPVLESICATFGARFHLEIPADSVWTVYIDPVLIEQAITNIVKNAAESAGEGGNVTLTLSRPGVTVTVTDDGPGISAETAGMLFTPFFSTKPSGHGLGLLLVSEVLTSHGARFSLRTASDGLTRFTIRF